MSRHAHSSREWEARVPVGQLQEARAH
jgi:hypothetical protein